MPLPVISVLVATSLLPSQVIVERQALQMGTIARAVVAAPTRDLGLQLAGEAIAEIEAVEAILSTWRPSSEVSRINSAPIGEASLLSPALAAMLSTAFELAECSDYAFDPAIGAATEAWDIHGSGRRPTASELEGARRASSAQWFALDRDRITRLALNAKLDTGGFGKGLGLDAAAKRLRSRGVEAALLDLGGQLVTIGGPVEVTIANPTDRSLALAVATMSAGSVSTSGNSERAVRAGGEVVGHILDPRTAGPAEDFGSVTVFAPTGVEADALSTALFVLGPERGLALANRLADIDAVFAVAIGEGCYELRATPGLRQSLRLLDSSARIMPGWTLGPSTSTPAEASLP